DAACRARRQLPYAGTAHYLSARDSGDELVRHDGAADGRAGRAYRRLDGPTGRFEPELEADRMQPPPQQSAGIVYNTTMSRPDAALSLARLYGLEGKREARVASIGVTENSFGAAAFVDAVFRFYQLGQMPNANRTLPIGLATDKPHPPDSVMVKAVLERK